MGNTPDRNYNTAQIMHDETHDGVGANFPYNKVVISNDAPLQAVTASSSTTVTLVTWTAGTTTGTVHSIVANALTSGLGLSVTSSATAITGAGRLGYFYHSGVTSTSGTLFEIKSDATDETVLFTINATAALAAGKGIHLNTNSMTTGTALDIDLAALTTGIGIDLSSCPVVKMGINFVDGTASTIDPSATAETGWINVGVAGTVRYIPYYAAS